jgi:predicted membrane channel-forming protein YqfA (hemolysin III family)
MTEEHIRALIGIAFNWGRSLSGKRLRVCLSLMLAWALLPAILALVVEGSRGLRWLFHCTVCVV